MDSDYRPPLSKRKCCVPKCKNREGKMHRFPKNEPIIFSEWILKIRPLNYENFSTEDIYKKYVVCDEHFSRDCKVVGTKRGLKRTAIPTLNLPEITLADNDKMAKNDEFSAEISDIYLDPKPGPSTRYDEDYPTVLGETNEEIRPETPKQSRLETRKRVLPRTPKKDEDYPTVLGEKYEELRPETPKQNRVETPKQSRVETRKRVIPRTPKKGIKLRGSILKEINVTRAVQLTPKAKKLYSRVKECSKKMYQMGQKIKSFKGRLCAAEKVANSENFNCLLKYVNDTTYTFINCQIKNQQLSPKARRYTLEEKILALSLYKNSAKGYKLLSKLFALPSRRTLDNLLTKIPYEPGINEHIFLSLKSKIENMKVENEKFCILMFDEMAISSQFNYQRAKDIIIGLQDDGSERKAVLADHANVFMLKGLYKQWKQPLAFTFSEGPHNSIVLKNLLKTLIGKCQSIGLKVVSTVCDQSENNVGTIRLLLNETNEEYLRRNEENRNFGFVVNNQEIIPIFDVPHIFKCLRNNLLKHDLHFTQNGQPKIAKWNHIIQFYELDSEQPNFRICSKLTDSHIYRDKINKMKVKLCTQVFSHTVGSLMKRISEWELRDRNKLPQEAENTADLILLFDQIFDSLNVSRISKGQAKPLKLAVRKGSPHEDFWKESLSLIATMKYFSLEKNKYFRPPSLKNLQHNLRAFIYLKKILIEKFKFKYILTAAFNQDPLENFFSYIRSHGVTNTKPSAVHFIGSFKAIVTNNFMAAHSPNANCIKDYNSYGLDNLQSFLTSEIVPVILPLEKQSRNTPELPKEIYSQGRTKIEKCTMQYMVGAIGKIMMKQKLIKNCSECRSLILKRHYIPSDDDFIESRKYPNAQLVKPGNFFSHLVKNSLNSLFYKIPRICELKNISQHLVNSLDKDFKFNTFNCSNVEHNSGKKLRDLVIRCALFWWCKSINNIFQGKDNNFYKFILQKRHKDLIDPIKLHALKKFEKRKKKCLRRHIPLML